MLPAFYDLGLELFPHCNLNCKFCYQREISHFAETYENTVRLPKGFYVQKCLSQIKKHGLKGSKVYLVGGEIFYDNNAHYVASMKELVEYLNPSVINVTSNFVFDTDKSELFQYLLARPGFSLSVSYNVINRYTSKKQLDLFIANVKKHYKDFLDRGSCLSIEIVLQEDILTGKVELPLIDYIRELMVATGNRLVDVVFIIDYQGYSQDVLDGFNDYLLAFVKRYPVFQNVRYLYEPSRSKYCSQMQGTTFLTYNNDFKYVDHPVHCIDPSLDVDRLNKKLAECYGCSDCPYEKFCKDVCTAGLEKSGLLRHGQYCYHRFLFDHYSSIMRVQVG